MISIERDGLGTAWVPVAAGATLYQGSIVVDGPDGVSARLQADGVADLTNLGVPYGIVIGHNLVNEPAQDSTYKAWSVTDEGATGVRSSTTEYRGVDGTYGVGDKRLYVQIDLIGPQTVLKAPLFNAAEGVVPTVLTSTAGNANGLTVTTNATDVAGVADLATVYCRTGQNAGTYRITDDTSTTVLAWDVEMLKTTADVGDTYVRVPVKDFGKSFVRFGAGDVTNGYINTASTPATNYDIIHVHELNLRESNKEYCVFRFDADHFCAVRDVA